jgi:hypothetical protein
MPRITTLKQLRKKFWETFPNVPRTKITHYSGQGKMWPTDTRCAFVDWIDALSRNGEISQEFAERATL